MLKKGKKEKPTAIDLFCGCGGLTAGLKRAGFQVVGAVDIDSLSVKIYRANHREIHVWEQDIRSLKSSEVLKKLGLKKGKLDLLAGCPPCQGFSKIRTLNGALRIRDSRNNLLSEFVRFVEKLRPRAVMMENVPGLAEKGLFYQYCRKLKDLGYIGEHRVLNAADYGVPQRRRRLIYLAGRGAAIPFAEVSQNSKTVKDAIRGLPKAGKSGDLLHDMPEHRTSKVMDIIKRIPKNGGSRTDLPAKFQLACHKNCDGFKDVYGRMAWNSTAPTITTGCFNPSRGRFLHPVENRAITMREASLLQGFPRGYKFPIADNKSAVAMMIGNALPPPFIAAHSRNIRRILKSNNGFSHQRGESNKNDHRKRIKKQIDLATIRRGSRSRSRSVVSSMRRVGKVKNISIPYRQTSRGG